MKSVENLAIGDYIAFEHNKEIIVDCVSKILEDKALIYFMGVTVRYEVEKENVLAIGNNETGEGTIKGWSGKYDILNQERIDEILDREKLYNSTHGIIESAPILFRDRISLFKGRRS